MPTLAAGRRPAAAGRPAATRAGRRCSLASYRTGPHLLLDGYRNPPDGADRARPPADRCPPRLARPARPQDALPRPAARLGDQPARAADLRRRARGEPGLPLPGAPAAGE